MSIVVILVILLIITLVAVGFFYTNTETTDVDANADTETTDVDANADTETTDVDANADTETTDVDAETNDVSKDEPLTCEEGQVKSNGECLTVSYVSRENSTTYGHRIKSISKTATDLESMKNECTMNTKCNHIVDYAPHRNKFYLLATNTKERPRRGVTSYDKVIA
jgi:lipopolysaccharide export system protein LptC